ncbi:MAG: hypothetical protein C5B54_10790, partial [Acidobacteria bacterium]
MNKQPVSLSPARLAFHRLRKNRIAMAGAVLLSIFYVITIFAGFFAPYSPSADEFRAFFFHPPTPLHFQDEHGFHLRPAVDRTYLLDNSRLIYASTAPVNLYYRNPSANVNPYFPEMIESEVPLLRVADENGKLLAEVFSMKETAPDSGLFVTALAVDPKGRKIVITSREHRSTTVPVTNQPPTRASTPPQLDLFFQDGDGHYINEYYAKHQRLPVQFFVRGWRYRILWIFQSDLHLFGVNEPGHVFLFGTDQAGRDLFSRILFGAQISLTVGLVGVVLTSIFGMLLGAIAGYYGGQTDNFVMRFAEIL